MRGATWKFAALCGLMLASPGCAQHGFLLDWSLELNRVPWRTSCGHCQSCDGCSANEDGGGSKCGCGKRGLCKHGTDEAVAADQPVETGISRFHPVPTRPVFGPVTTASGIGPVIESSPPEPEAETLPTPPPAAEGESAKRPRRPVRLHVGENAKPAPASLLAQFPLRAKRADAKL